MSVELSKQLIALGLHYVAENLDDVIALATKNRWGTVELLTHVTEHEAKGRAQRPLLAGRHLCFPSFEDFRRKPS